ncbi:hypothetical protein FHQ26_12220 [Testudinibacter sp. TR-2022]|uniref:capsular polysaccharide synthesis protein n=1 Tax=Testudinibacter sp. TR-2022 TaxID=2585029 RepID=UPI00111A4BF4|nr:capsular polysaccharide synthesis protein [Testudinibacter sp. TR-2022]TNH02786.1 hypothetical protein FHQ22_09450 [Pasteurellaceae bacterium Phil31]TNH04793.1 hypothetical protein FHQ26_12220 [Testudinibacter sp. TR-2022]TNH07583.1 hypothetical protein FHQ25_10985 [Testudinibacter sp. TR-2022]TNH11190.1 hypothetical protein FIA56_11600 [Testudinibacter sp. TR-2022]TNH19590.1 hypothetical protein FHQ23_02330 [Testudinibacter sp. TR-2022]
MAAKMNKNFIAQLIEKLETVNKSSYHIFTEQDLTLRKLTQSNQEAREKITKEFLQLASMLNKNELTKFSTQRQSIVNNLLQAPYDAKAAFGMHKAFFAERHEMAMFILENLVDLKKITQYKIDNATPAGSYKIKVFTYWHDANSLPPLVSHCRASLKKYISSEFDLIILDENNYKDWIDCDLENLRNSISQAHFTDLLRLRLLEKWGGFWLDATCLLSEDFYTATHTIRQQEHFFFSYINSRVGNWFIWSKPHSYVITMISEVLTCWWAQKNRLTNYFMTHDIIEMLYWVDDEYRKHWDNMYKLHPKNALLILREYNTICSKDEFNIMLKSSFVHKLNYKYDTNKITKSGSLDRLLHNENDQ